jgi:hypothetical protein
MNSQEGMVDEAHDHDFVPDIAVADGMRIQGDGFVLECIATPGHTANHICYGLLQEQALFSGDHVMGWSTSVIAPPDGDMGDYLASLERLKARDDRVLYPTHGSPIAAPKVWIGQLIGHRLSLLTLEGDIGFTRVQTIYVAGQGNDLDPVQELIGSVVADDHRGPSLLDSPPMDGSKLTHQTSPRFIRDVPDRGFRPLVSLGLTALVRRHIPVGVSQVARNHVRTDQTFDELADLLSADHTVQSLIDLFIHGNGKFLVQDQLLRTGYVFLGGPSPGVKKPDPAYPGMWHLVLLCQIAGPESIAPSGLSLTPQPLFSRPPPRPPGERGFKDKP